MARWAEAADLVDRTLVVVYSVQPVLLVVGSDVEKKDGRRMAALVGSSHFGSRAEPPDFFPPTHA